MRLFLVGFVIHLMLGCAATNPGPAESVRPAAPARGAGHPPQSMQAPRSIDALDEACRTALQYEVRSFPVESADGGTGLVVSRRGEWIEVIPPGSGTCLRLIHEQDLDGDGLLDAVVGSSCGGNAAPTNYLFVAGRCTGALPVHELGAQWDEPIVGSENGRPSITIESNNEGSNLDRPERVTQRFVFENGAPLRVAETRATEMKALVELRAEQFEGRAPDDALILTFDLDSDGKPDELSATLWERWGRLFWQIRFAEGTTSGDSGLACKRLGVLPERTQGHHDLVCDIDTRLRWDGKQYIAVGK